MIMGSAKHYAAGVTHTDTIQCDLHGFDLNRRPGTDAIIKISVMSQNDRFLLPCSQAFPYTSMAEVVQDLIGTYPHMASICETIRA